MTTLHALRRSYALSFSELAVLTAVPVRHLAEFEYHGHPLSAAEHQSLAAFFGVAETTLEGGFVARHVAKPTLTQSQAQALAAIAAVAALAWSLRLGQPSSVGSSGTPMLTAMNAGANPGRGSFNKLSSRFEVMTPTPSPEATLLSTVTPEPTTPPPLTNTPAPTATPKPTAVPTATAPLEPTALPTATPQPQPTATPRPVRAFRLRKQPTPVPQMVRAQPATTVQQAQLDLPALNLSDAGDPQRCPVLPARGRVILTQGYGVGTHAPAELWGGIDLAVAGGPTAGATVVAAHAGYVQVALDSWPGGNFVSVSSDTGWRTAYAHLATVVVEPGQYVQAGTPIGTIGSTGNTTGPHLHFETWYNGVNVDPSPNVSCR